MNYKNTCSTAINMYIIKNMFKIVISDFSVKSKTINDYLQ